MSVRDTMTPEQRRVDAELRAKYSHLYGEPVDSAQIVLATRSIRRTATRRTSAVRAQRSTVAWRAAEERRRHGQPAWASYGDTPTTWSGLALRYDVPVVGVDETGAPCYQIFRRAAMDPLFNGEPIGLPVLLSHGLLDDGTRSEVLTVALGRAKRVDETRSGLRAEGILLDTPLVAEVVDAIRSWDTPGLSVRALVEDCRLLPDRKRSPSGREVWPVYEITRAHLVEVSFTPEPADDGALLDELGGRPLTRRTAPAMTFRQALDVAALASGSPTEGELRTELYGLRAELENRSKVRRAQAFRHRPPKVPAERYARRMTDSGARERMAEIYQLLAVYDMAER